MMSRTEVINSAAMAVGVSTRFVELRDSTEDGYVHVYVLGKYICSRRVQQECRICGTIGVLQYGLCSNCVSPVTE
jgi:hypothetical protein